MNVKEWIPLKQVAAALGLSHSHVRHMVNSQMWNAELMGRDYFMHVSEIERIRGERIAAPPRPGPKPRVADTSENGGG